MTDSSHTPSPAVTLKKQLGESNQKKKKKSVTVLLPADPEIGSDGQRMVQITPSSLVQSLCVPFTEELDLGILVDSFQLRLFCDCVSPRVECLVSAWRQQSGNCATVIKHLSCRQAATVCQVIIRTLVTAQKHSEHSSGSKYVGKNQWLPWHKHTETRSSPEALCVSPPKRQGIGLEWRGRSGIMTSVRNHLIQELWKLLTLEKTRKKYFHLLVFEPPLPRRLR